MFLRRTCRDITRLILEGQDRPMTWNERLVLRLHLSACSACTGFRRQVQFMDQAMGAWRRYGDDGR